METERNLIVRMNKVHSSMLNALSKRYGYTKSDTVRYLIINEVQKIERSAQRRATTGKGKTSVQQTKRKSNPE